MLRSSILLLGLTSIAHGLVTSQLTAADVALPRSGIDLTGMDRSVKPHEDFYRFANGVWLDKTQIPPDRPRQASFSLLQDRNRAILRKILEEAAADSTASADSIVGKVGSFYRTGMDEDRIEKAGAKPLEPELERIAAITDGQSLLKSLAHLHSLHVSAGFVFMAFPDLKNSKQMIATVFQGGLGMPDRDYYLKTDDKTKQIREAYVKHVAKLFTLLGDAGDKAEARARKVLEFETRLARSSRARVELRDPRANYNIMTVGRIGEETPGIQWKAYFSDVGLPGLESLNVGQPAFLKEFGAMAASVPLEDWKVYLRWRLVDEYADKLSSEFVKEDFHFKQTILRGVPLMRPRWERVLEATDQLLGEALGQLYVARAFKPEAKARAEILVGNVRAALRERIETLDWMTAPTKKEALKKLAAIGVKIGYPSKWRDYSELKLDGESYFANVLRAQTFTHRFNMNKIGKPVDPAEWSMTPSTVNAYYNPSRNEIVFPAGILQPPFFDADADDAVNYGGIGMVIGHELTHGFDDQGRQFDADGNLRDWWSPQDEKIYKERAALIARQYDGYVAVDTLRVNGRLTLGENIADLGGLRMAYRALQRALRDKEPVGLIDGYNQEQRFFLAYAQIWRDKRRPEMARVMVATDPHSPPQWRVMGPLYNMPEFFKAFGINPQLAKERLNPQPVQIW